MYRVELMMAFECVPRVQFFAIETTSFERWIRDKKNCKKKDDVQDALFRRSDYTRTSARWLNVGPLRHFPDSWSSTLFVPVDEHGAAIAHH
jgi:hypothetical protein